MKIQKSQILELDLFYDNCYLDKYLELLQSNTNTPRIKFETERHHVIPRCCYLYLKKSIDNSSENILNLSHIDHLYAHYYLALCAKPCIEDKLTYAFIQMLYCNKNLTKLTESDFEYAAKLRRDFAETVSKNISGRVQGLEERKKRSESARGKNTGPKSEAHKKKLSEAAKNRAHGSTLGRTCIYNPTLGKKKYVTEEQINAFLLDGWQKGGLPHTEASKRAIGDNSRRCLTGKTRSKESNLKQSESLKKRWKETDNGWKRYQEQRKQKNISDT